MRRLNVDPIREIILNILVKIDSNQGYINVLVNQALKKNKIVKRDAAFIHEITYGVIRNRIKIDWVISRFSANKIDKMKILIRNIVRMSIYQMLFLKKVPGYAACNEAVQLAKKYGNIKTASFVNAILRNIIRRENEIKWPEKEKEPALYLSIMYSHPLWVIERWIKRFGYENTLKICIANNTIPPLTIRTNTLKLNRSDLKEILEKEEIMGVEGQFTGEALYVKGITNVSEHSGFKNGLFQIQDESSILVSHLVNPLPGELVIDVCSAPGGKTTHLAQLMNNKGIVIAMDISKNKLKTINENCNRLGINIVKILQHDATKTKKEYLNKADKVLVDVPCSCLGVLRRKPDIKLQLFNRERLFQLSQLQLEILSVSSDYVKEGGALIYSTCSTENEENREVVKKFLKRSPHFELENLSTFNKKRNLIVNKSKENEFIKIYPGISNSNLDGFFMARMIKKGQ